MSYNNNNSTSNITMFKWGRQLEDKIQKLEKSIEAKNEDIVNLETKFENLQSENESFRIEIANINQRLIAFGNMLMYENPTKVQTKISEGV